MAEKKGNMTRSKHQALFKFLPDTWVSEGMNYGMALTSKITKWNWRKMEGVYKKFIEGEIKRQIQLFKDRGGNVNSYGNLESAVFDIVEPNCVEGIPDILGEVSPLFFYCSKCGNAIMQKDSRSVPYSEWKCPQCKEGNMKQLQMIYVCECGHAEPIKIPYSNGAKLKYYPNRNPFKVYYKDSNGVEKTKEFTIKCSECGNMLLPDNVVSGRNYKPFSVKTINLVDENSGRFYEKGLKAYKTVVSRWFNNIEKENYYNIINNVDKSFDSERSFENIKKQAEDLLETMKGCIGCIDSSFRDLFITEYIAHNTSKESGSVDKSVLDCDVLFADRKNNMEFAYNDWLRHFSFKLMQYYTIKDSQKQITLKDSIERQISLDLIDSADELLELQSKLGIKNMQVCCDTQIITSVYGYTRKTMDPVNNVNKYCQLKLNDYGRNKEGNIITYGGKLETEGLLFDIDIRKIILWLRSNDVISETQMPDIDDEISVKKWYANNVNGSAISSFGEVVDDGITSAVFSLLHSISHSFIKTAGELSGLAGNSLSEMIFTETASIFIYAQTSQGIPLGAISGMAECRYAQFLKNAYTDSKSCIFDPICQERDDSVCSGCLIIPDTACNSFNNMLGRKYLYSLKKSKGFATGFWEME